MINNKSGIFLALLSTSLFLFNMPSSYIKADVIEEENIIASDTKETEVSCSNVISYAQRFLGVPYVWGGTSPSGFDCSGFTQYVFKNTIGIDIGRLTYDQINAGKEVAYNELKPGDLVFTNSAHVGLYIGNGQMIHSPQTGDAVKISNVYSFWRARRIIDDSNTEKVPETPQKPIAQEVPDIIGGDVSIRNASSTEMEILFNSSFYAEKYDDLRRAFGFNSDSLLRHYTTYGVGEGRSASVIFDAAYYLEKNPDLANAFGRKNYKAAYNHFLTYGHAEGRVLSPVFDMSYYVRNNPDVKAAFGNNHYAIMKHFLQYGMKEGRLSSPNFNFRKYKSYYEDLRKAYGENNDSYYRHYCIYGRAEGRASI